MSAISTRFYEDENNKKQYCTITLFIHSSTVQLFDNIVHISTEFYYELDRRFDWVISFFFCRFNRLFKSTARTCDYSFRLP